MAFNGLKNKKLSSVLLLCFGTLEQKAWKCRPFEELRSQGVSEENSIAESVKRIKTIP
jgi:hypothetical protein